MKRIVWALYGNNDPGESIDYVKFFAGKYHSEIVAVYVKPTSYFEGIEYLPSEQKGAFYEWVEKSSQKIIDQIETHSEELTKSGVRFRTVIKSGVPHEEIMDSAIEEKADLVIAGRGKSAENEYSLSRTVFKLIRQSTVPVMSVDKPQKDIKLERILVPTGMYDIHSGDFSLALNISNEFGSRIYHLNVMTSANLNLPAEVVNKLRGDTYTKIAEKDIEYKNVEPTVIESVNPAKGITMFAKEKDIDLVVMLVYSGKKKRGAEFIGTVAQKVLQEASCPVITLKP